jgi:hypothetical protein
MENIVNTFRPILIKYFGTKRTNLDAGEFFKTYSNVAQGSELLDIFAVMSSENNNIPKELKEIGRKLTIGILRYPNIDFSLEDVYKKYLITVKKTVDTLKGPILSNIINKECDEKDKRYWDRILEDMEIGYYDDFMKNLLGVRKELLVNLEGSQYNGISEGSGYTKETITDYIDIEFIKNGMYSNSYNFVGLFNAICDVISSRLHPHLKESFTPLCNNFIKEHKIRDKDTSNATSVLLLRFIINHLFDFLYLDVEEIKPL